VTRSTELVSRVVEAGEHTRSAIDRLNQQVEQIDSIADLIGQIAARTNLLALNATIEAARAGDAGKGFAVVAGEVKSLAAQNARSTADINRFIGWVRAAVQESSAAVAQIERTIAEVNSIAAAIATVVERQNVATSEIARNVIVTSSAAQQVNGRTEAVSEEVRQVQTHANEVRAVTDNLTGTVACLRRRVVAVLRGSAS
jgi:methyl-accepting chemotaxis protein